jgi:hypothetical protein
MKHLILAYSSLPSLGARILITQVGPGGTFTAQDVAALLAQGPC